MNKIRLEQMFKIASNDAYIKDVLKVLDKTQIPCAQIDDIVSFAENLPNDVTEYFDPWSYIAGYIETKEQFWDIIYDTLNEEFVTYVYITYGWEQGLLRNRLNLKNKEDAMKYFKNPIAVFIEGNTHKSFFEQFIMCKTHKAYILDALKELFIVKIYTNIKENDVFEQIKNTLYKDLEVNYIESKEQLYNYDTLICLNVNTTFLTSIHEHVNSSCDVFCSGFFVKKKESNSILYLSENTSMQYFVLH